MVEASAQERIEKHQLALNIVCALEAYLEFAIQALRRRHINLQTPSEGVEE